MAFGPTDVDSVSYGRLINLATNNVPPPTEAYVGGDDRLHVNIATSQPNTTVRVFSRILLPDGTIVPNAWSFAPLNGRAGQDFFQNLTEGFLLSLSVDSLPANAPGQTWVRCSLLRGNLNSPGSAQILVLGYVTGVNVLSWPISPAWPKSYGRGNMRVVTGTVPAAGQEINEVVPANVLWRLVTFIFTLLTSAAGSARTPLIVFDDGAAPYLITQTGAPVAASTSIAYNMAAVFPLAGPVGGQAMIPGVKDLFLSPGFRIRTSTLGLDPGDRYLQIDYLVEEWLA
jgi:hypothetical protein